jgi:hypothetical protein
MCDFAPAAVVRALREGRSVSFVALGGSMEPLVPAGSRVRVVPAHARDVRFGQIVAITRPDGGIALHRIVARAGPDKWFTWGDAMAHPDDWADAEIIGRLECMEPSRTLNRWRRSRSVVRIAWHVLRAHMMQWA